MEPVSSQSKWIPAHGYSLLYPETGSSGFADSRVTLFFGLGTAEEPFSIRFDRTTLGLTGSGREIYLADSTQTVIDMAAYSPQWHNPNLIDTKGIALERINPALDTNDPLNWGSNTSITGGSPMAQNSLFQLSGELPSNTGISLYPNPFSPDADGFDDSLFINYTFNEPDYLLRIRIFDRYGRLIRKLTESHPAGFEGSVIWDGRMDNGQNNRIGIYIVFVEAYNSSNGKSRTFRETAVLAKQF
jgi:gliding motility-associated-like protein